MRLLLPITALLATMLCMALVPAVAGAVSHEHHGSSSAAKPSGAQLRWSDPRAWPSRRVPRAGSAVTIPKGRSILLDRSVRLASLKVNGTLTFARRNLMLEADWIMVHGALRVGTKARPFRQRATIRIRDARRNQDVMKMGDKVLGVMGSGRLELHGQPKRAGWTRLGATANRGTRRIRIASSTTGWRRGDRIAIASTDFAHDQAEVRTIRSIRGGVVTLDAPLDWRHFGRVQRLGGRRVDERAEVALLTRNVTIEGDASTDRTRLGAQVMVMDRGRLTFDGVQLRRVGQAGKLRRYPIHFHMLAAQGRHSSVRNSSIHDSDNRCMTVHGTHRVTLADNVCFDHYGHGIFLEDGNETDNVIVRNLVFGTKRPDNKHQLLGSDRTPGSYWITHPDNDVRRNVAAGGEGHGFWIALPEHPTGYSAFLRPGAMKQIWPRRTALGTFAANVAHSNDQDGLHFDTGPKPDGTTEATHHHARRDPADTKSATVTTKMPGMVAWKNRGHGAWLRGTEHRLTGAVLADNGVGATMASSESFVQDSLIVGETANRGTPSEWERRSGKVGRAGRSLPRPWDPELPIRGFEFYDGRVGVERTTFVNFQSWQTASGAWREQGAIGAKLDNKFNISPRNFATKVRFVNAKPVWLQTPPDGYDGSRSTAFLDTDGSVTGRAGATVSVRRDFLAGSGCTAQGGWNAQVCGGRYASLLIGTDASTLSALRPVTVTRSDGRQQQLVASSGTRSTTAQTSLLVGDSYRLAFAGGTPARTELVLRNGRDHQLRVSFPRAEGFRVERYGCDVSAPRSWCFSYATSAGGLDTLTRSGYFYDNHGDSDPATGTMHLRLIADGADWEALEVVPAS